MPTCIISGALIKRSPDLLSQIDAKGLINVRTPASAGAERCDALPPSTRQSAGKPERRRHDTACGIKYESTNIPSGV